MSNALLTLNLRSKPEGRPNMTDRESCQDEWFLARTVLVNDTELSATTRNWNYAQSRFLAIPRRWNQVSLSVIGYGDGNGAGNPGSGSFSWKLYACRRNGPPEVVANGTWAIGDMEVSHCPWNGAAVGSDPFTTADQSNYKLGELPVVTNDNHSSTITPSGATDQLGALNFDPAGCWGFYLEITNLSGITTLYVMATGR